MQFGGELKSILEILDSDPINFIRDAGISPDFAGGRARGRAILDFPLRKNLSTSEVRVVASGFVGQVGIADVARGMAFAADDLAFELEEKNFSVSGTGKIGNIPVSGIWSKEVREGIDSGSILAGTIPLSGETIKALGVELPENFIIGEETANFRVELASAQTLGSYCRPILTNCFIRSRARLAEAARSAGPAYFYYSAVRNQVPGQF